MNGPIHEVQSGFDASYALLEFLMDNLSWYLKT